MTIRGYIPDPSTPATEADRLIDDAYYTGQSQDGIGSPLSAYVLRYIQRLGGYVYLKLYNKEPGAALRTYDASARGHDHDGTDSTWIGGTVAACGMRTVPSTTLAIAVDNAAADSCALSSQGWMLAGHFGQAGLFSIAGYRRDASDTDINRPMLTSAQNIRAPLFGTAVPTFPQVRFGPGSNRAHVHLHWALLTTDDSSGAETSTLVPVTGTDVIFTLTCGASTVTKTVSSGARGYNWTHLTSSTLLTVTPDAANDISIEAELDTSSSPDAYALVVYGYTITEERA